MITFTSKFSSDNIDKVKGVIRATSLVSLGQVQGHDCWADAKTLATVLAAAKRAGKVKCKIDHTNSVNQICGSLSNFRLSPDGQKVLGDLKLLKSCPSYDYILELADQLAGQVALSIAFDPEFEKRANGQRLVRCKELWSADLVSDGAANPDGLFSESPTVGQSLVGTNTDSAVAIPTGHKIKGQSVGTVCPQCEKTSEFLSKLVTLHDNAADHLEELCATFQPKDDVSSGQTEQQFQRRLELERVKLEKEFENKASIAACHMLSRTGVRLSKIPDSDTCRANGGNDILDQMNAIQDPTAQGLFYQKNREAVNAAFSKRGARNIALENKLKTTAGVA